MAGATRGASAAAVAKAVVARVRTVAPAAEGPLTLARGEGVPAEMLPGVGGILGGDGGGKATGGGDNCTAVCDPQLAPSAQKHVSKQMPLPGGELTVGIGSGWRMLQSAPSVPYWPSGYSAPGPPSSQQ